MDGDQPGWKSFLKRRSGSPKFKDKASQAHVSASRIEFPQRWRQPVMDYQHERSSEELMQTLDEARCLEDHAKKVLSDLKKTKYTSYRGRQVSVRTAHKMLSDVRDLYVKQLNEQTVLAERLKVKAEALSTVKEAVTSLLQEVQRNISELSEELKEHKDTQALQEIENEENQGMFPEFFHASTSENQAESVENVENAHISRNIITPTNYQTESSAEGEPGQVASIDFLIASMTEKRENQQNEFISRLETARSRREELEETLRKINREIELSRQKQMDQMQDVLHECLVKNNELLAARAVLESVEAEVRAIDTSIEDFASPAPESCDEESLVNRIQHMLEVLKTVNLPDKELRQLCIDLQKVFNVLASIVTATRGRESRNEESQTLLTGARLSEAITSHAARLLEKERQRRRDYTKRLKASEKARKSLKPREEATQ